MLRSRPRGPRWRTAHGRGRRRKIRPARSNEKRSNGKGKKVSATTPPELLNGCAAGPKVTGGDQLPVRADSRGRSAIRLARSGVGRVRVRIELSDERMRGQRLHARGTRGSSAGKQRRRRAAGVLSGVAGAKRAHRRRAVMLPEAARVRLRADGRL